MPDGKVLVIGGSTLTQGIVLARSYESNTLWTGSHKSNRYASIRNITPIVQNSVLSLAI